MQLDVVVFNGGRYCHTQSNNQHMALKTELPKNLLLPLTTIQQQTQNILPTKIYHQLKYMPMTTNFPPPFPCQKKTSLWQRESKVYQYISKLKCISTFYLRIGILQHSLSRGNLMLTTHEILLQVLKLKPGKRFGENVTQLLNSLNLHQLDHQLFNKLPEPNCFCMIMFAPWCVLWWQSVC